MTPSTSDQPEGLNGASSTQDQINPTFFYGSNLSQPSIPLKFFFSGPLTTSNSSTSSISFENFSDQAFFLDSQPMPIQSPCPSTSTSLEVQSLSQPKVALRSLSFTGEDLEELAWCVIDFDPFNQEYGKSGQAWEEVLKKLQKDGQFLGSSVKVIQRKVSEMLIVWHTVCMKQASFDAFY
jgi:hypothetical protein